jgi:two-component system chemotaxis response regulator CheB
MIRVLVVEDSPVVREFLVHVLNSDPEVRVIATASNGEEAVEAVERVKPDIITMDIHMPKMNGLEASRRIMRTHPTPIVIVSGTWDPREATRTFHAMEAGALAVVARPEGMGHPNHADEAAQLIQTVKLMSEVKVVRRWDRPARGASVTTVLPPREVALKPMLVEVKLVAMGASTGGPLALQTIFSDLPRDFSAPILVVQHMAAGFIEGFAEWIAQTSSLPVRVATQGEPLLPGHAYLAPDGFQMEVGAGGRISLTTDKPENGLRPSVSCLFRSVANTYGQNAVGVLLTGMGRDGAEELRLMKEKGAVTIAQDKESSIVHGMPGEAINLDAATYVLSPGRIAEVLAKFASKKTE